MDVYDSAWIIATTYSIIYDNISGPHNARLRDI